MARLQDFNTVTPTSADKLLVVQSQGQGLVPYGSKLDSANPTGTGSLSLNRKASTTVGSYSTAEGLNCEASGSYSHAEGQGTKATSYHAHAEGQDTIASGYRTHAEGQETTASGQASHAEGRETVSSGIYSHSDGYGTIANHKSQHVFGEYNTADASTAAATARGNFVEIVGKGTSDSARSNARTLDWSGNEVLAGGLMVNESQHVYGTEVLENIGANETKTYTIPSSMFANNGVYILAFGSSYAVGSVYILSIRSAQSESVIFTELKSSSFITLSSTAKDKFTVTTGQAAFNVSLTRIG